ncbi:MAG: PilZ domain-containing protein [Myxococcota bacterium]
MAAAPVLEFPKPAGSDLEVAADPRPALALPSASELRQRFRQEPRIDTTASAMLTTPGVRVHGVALNVSPRGAFIATSATLNPGAEVTVDLVLGDHQRVSGRAVVRWVRPWNRNHPRILPGVGIELASTESEALETLSNFVRSASSSPTP